VILAALASCGAACGGRPDEPKGAPLATELAAETVGIMATLPALRQPIRCVAEGAPRVVAGDGDKQTLRLAVVTGARGPQTFDPGEVDAVLVAGGVDLEGLRGLAAVGRPVVLLPGELDAVPALEALATQVPNVLSATEVSALEIDGIVVGLLPGVPAAQGPVLGAGVDGCVYYPDDVARVAALKPRVLVSILPPRQRGSLATDVVEGAIHVGDPSLWSIGAPVVIHGLVEAPRIAAAEASTAAVAVPDNGWVLKLIVAAGALDPLPPGRPTIAVIEVADGRARAHILVR
jgi:hypothetical protein